MIVPTAREVLAMIERTLTDVVEPDCGTMAARSALATTGHLLRHVQLRLEHEGQVLTDDIAALRPLLHDVAAWLDRTGAPVASIAAALSRTFRATNAYPTLESLGEEAGTLRHALTDALERLIALRADHGTDPAYLALRQDIRTYLAAQINAEAVYVGPAFTGKGPRR